MTEKKPLSLGVLSDPANFHTQKWVKALKAAGAEVSIFSFDPVPAGMPGAVQLQDPGKPAGEYSYLSYLRGGRLLREALHAHKIDILNPLNLTPFGVWAMQSGFKPVVACAFGADILEYLPDATHLARSWDANRLPSNTPELLLRFAKNRFHRFMVKKALRHAALITADNQTLVEGITRGFGIPSHNTRLLRWGIEEEMFIVDAGRMKDIAEKFSLAPESKLVLSPRGAKPVYNADILFAAFRKMLDAGRSDTHFIFMTAGYEADPALEREALRLQAENPLFHYQKAALSREEMHALWNRTDVFVSAPVYDGYSASLAEGRYAGAVPIVNAIPGNLELIRDGENGIIVQPFEADTLAVALTQALDNLASLKARFGPVNRSWIEAHSLMGPAAVQFLDACQRVLISGK